jgi:glycerophosphoryl diester phosphodiesterase
MAVYNLNGDVIGIDDEKNLNYDANVLSVNHRGYSAEAPENTLPAYILSKKKGFNYVETDVCFTSDGIPVLLHDATIDRTSNGTGNINSMTYEQVRAYDFGSWKSSTYAGTKIPSLAEFLYLCKSIMLHPYIELKSSGAYTQAQIQQIVDMVHSYGLKGKVSYISFSSDRLYSASILSAIISPTVTPMSARL